MSGIDADAQNRNGSIPKGVDEGFGVTPVVTSTSDVQNESLNRETTSEPIFSSTTGPPRVYKRRWFGLLQLVLLNIVVSWNWLTFSPISRTSADFFDVSETAINWLSTGFLFAFVTIAPVTLKVLNYGPQRSILTASALVFVGSWIRYGGTRITSSSTSRFGVVMFGQILIGFAQPFVLAAPTRFSDLWFSERGRIAATALASLANPFGGALGQLINPFWAVTPSDVPNTVLYTAIISTIATLPSPFLPAKPPTPVSASASDRVESLAGSIRLLKSSRPFWVVLFPFAIYVGLFNAISSLLNQILSPYHYTEDDAGIAGAILIVTGLVASAILSPVFDRLPSHLLPIKILVPITALSYLAFIWAPSAGSLAAPYIILAILGAASFSLLPVTLEYAVEVAWPASPEVGSVIMWSASQLLGAIFIIIMGALKDESKGGVMTDALVFQAVLACVVVPLPLLLGLRRFGLERGAAKLRAAAGVQEPA